MNTKWFNSKLFSILPVIIVVSLVGMTACSQAGTIPTSTPGIVDRDASNGGFQEAFDDSTLPASDATSGGSSATTAGRTSTSRSSISIAGLGEKSAAQDGTVISPNKFASYVVGTISLDYAIISTSGLQGKLSYMWIFNGKPVGTGTSIDVDVPVTAEMVKGFEYNKANVLGIVSVTDSFGRSASASETITIGNPENLRAFTPAVAEQWGYVDPIEQVGQRQHGDPACIVGWQKEGGSVLQSMGALKSCSTFSVDGRDYAIVGTQKV
jgi:hypothetical protein